MKTFSFVLACVFMLVGPSMAGSSDTGMNLSARVADIAFTSQSSLKGAQTFYENVKSRCDRYGRSPDDMLVLPGALLFIGETESEAQEKYDRLNSLISFCRTSRNNNRSPRSRFRPPSTSRRRRRDPGQ